MIEIVFLFTPFFTINFFFSAFAKAFLADCGLLNICCSVKNIQNLVNLSWGKLSIDYPDDLPSLHTSSEGHVVAFNIIMAKFKENQWV